MQRASRLTKNVTSDVLAAQNRFYSKSAPSKVDVYVESDEDVAFWRNILHEYESDDIEFQILCYSKKGKNQAIERRREFLELESRLGMFLIVCVDSDYDYLLPEHTPQAKLINKDLFIFQTYSYSLENLQCFSKSLHPVCVQATKNDNRLIDFEAFLKTFSNIVYGLFLWNLHFRKNNDHQTFTISDFNAIIKLAEVNIADGCLIAINELKDRVDTKVAALQNDHPEALEEVNNLAADLVKYGVDKEQAYLFIQGHTLKNNVVLMVLKPVCQKLISEKFEYIKNNAQHAEQEENDREHYKGQKQDISLVLSANTEFKSCFLYKKIKADFDNYIANFYKA